VEKFLFVLSTDMHLDNYEIRKLDITLNVLCGHARSHIAFPWQNWVCLKNYGPRNLYFGHKQLTYAMSVGPKGFTLCKTLGPQRVSLGRYPIRCIYIIFWICTTMSEPGSIPYPLVCSGRVRHPKDTRKLFVRLLLKLCLVWIFKCKWLNFRRLCIVEYQGGFATTSYNPWYSASACYTHKFSLLTHCLPLAFSSSQLPPPEAKGRIRNQQPGEDYPGRMHASITSISFPREIPGSSTAQL